mmetsp:Transcript_12636/g.40307  ORF Transcript_12636/g.40307 Transcript_12636/m.40307 type:complete len:320 (+) Transcript_12636:748-1707(+)
MTVPTLSSPLPSRPRRSEGAFPFALPPRPAPHSSRDRSATRPTPRASYVRSTSGSASSATSRSKASSRLFSSAKARSVRGGTDPPTAGRLVAPPRPRAAAAGSRARTVAVTASPRRNSQAIMRTLSAVAEVASARPSHWTSVKPSADITRTESAVRGGMLAHRSGCGVGSRISGALPATCSCGARKVDRQRESGKCARAARATTQLPPERLFSMAKRRTSADVPAGVRLVSAVTSAVRPKDSTWHPPSPSGKVRASSPWRGAWVRAAPCSSASSSFGLQDAACSTRSHGTDRSLPRRGPGGRHFLGSPSASRPRASVSP